MNILKKKQKSKLTDDLNNLSHLQHNKSYNYCHSYALLFDSNLYISLLLPGSVQSNKSQVKNKSSINTQTEHTFGTLFY